MTQLKNRNIVVFGISADSVATHRDFARSERLNFSLLSDSTKKVIATYGALGTNGLPNRITFIVGPDGTLRGIDGNVNDQFVRRDNQLLSRHGENLSLLLSDWKASVGATIPNFFLPDGEGKTVSPRMSGKKATVIVFLGTQCEPSRQAATVLTQMAARPAYREVTFFGIDPNADTKLEALKAFAKSLALSFPLAYDPFGEVCEHFNPETTPSVWVLNSKGIVIYQGAITEGKAGRRLEFVQEALDAILAGRPASIAHTKAQGTPIHREYK